MTQTNWIEQARTLGQAFAERAAKHDANESFVAENYADLKDSRFFSLAVPAALGGGDAGFEETCRALRELGRHCPSTALALSMHTHLVAANVWKFVNGKPGADGMLKKVAEKQLVLVSTGATDWVDSNGSARRVPGGYRVSARKVFASGCPAADMLVTSVAFADGASGPGVLHFPLPLASEGVRILDDWHVLGMRGTGSHTVLIEDSFVPEEAIVLERPQGKWHPSWSVVLAVAPPIYMSPYVGLMDAAVGVALERARHRKAVGLGTAVGELHNARTQAHLAWEDMLRVTGNYDFTPDLDTASAQLTRKTLVANAVRKAAELAIEVAGGAGFYRKLPLERLWRDAQAAHFHPLPERRQLEFCGRQLLGQDVAAV